MSDGKKGYRAVENALHKLWPVEPRGNFARHVNSLAALISGIVHVIDDRAIVFQIINFTEFLSHTSL